MQIMRMPVKLILALLGLIAVSPTLFGAVAPVPCPTGFNCSYTYTAHWAPAIPTTVVVNWYLTPSGPIDHTRTLKTSTGSAAFEVPGGRWYVQLTVTADDGSVAPTMATYVIQYPTLLEPVGPAPPINFTVT